MKGNKGIATTTVIVVAIIIIIIGVVSTYYVTRPPVKPKLVVWGRASYAPAQMYWGNDVFRTWAEKRGIDIEITWIPVADCAPKMAAAVAAGTPPDVVIGGTPYQLYAERGLLVPLDDIVDELGRADIYPQKLKQGTVDGKVYAISSGFELTWLHTRKDYAEAAGVLGKFPIKSKEDYLLVSEKLTDVAPGVHGNGLPLGGSGFDCAWTFHIRFFGAGGGYTTGRSSAKVVFGTEPHRTKAKEVLSLYRTIFLNRWCAPDAGEWTDISNNLAYLDGRSAFTSNPMSIWYAIMTGKPELVPKTLLFPDWPMALDLGDECCFVFKGPNQDLGKELILHFYKDKKAYTDGWCRQSFWYNLPIFKSQMERIDNEWLAGKHPYWGVSPKGAVETSITELPLDPTFEEGQGVVDAFYRGWGINDMIVRAVVKGEDMDAVITSVHEKLKTMCKEEYGV